MSLRSNVTGTFTVEDLRRLTWPIAWSGTVDAQRRREEEADLSALVREAMDAIDGVVVAVEIESGNIVGHLTEVEQ